MAIDLNLPEPEEKWCNECGRGTHLKGILLHWPHKDFKKAYVTLQGGATMSPFSCWHYTCQWCRAVETKRRKRMEGSLKNGV